MNIAILMGRLVKDVDVRFTSGAEPMAVAKFCIAVDRKTKDKTADFINCVAFGKTAENIGKFFSKGNKIGIVGSIQTGSYEKDGQKIHTTDINVREFHFIEKMGQTDNVAPASGESNNHPVNQGFMSIPDDVNDGGLPFN